MQSGLFAISTPTRSCRWTPRPINALAICDARAPSCANVNRSPSGNATASTSGVSAAARRSASPSVVACAHGRTSVRSAPLTIVPPLTARNLHVDLRDADPGPHAGELRHRPPRPTCEITHGAIRRQESHRRTHSGAPRRAALLRRSHSRSATRIYARGNRALLGAESGARSSRPCAAHAGTRRVIADRRYSPGTRSARRIERASEEGVPYGNTTGSPPFDGRRAVRKLNVNAGLAQAGDES
jgi:hypothetical protein